MAPGRSARRSSTPQGEATRERILSAAVDLISERGYHATSVGAVCRRARIVKTALYWHFGSKEGLFAAALERVASSWIEEIKRSAEQGGDPGERLDRGLAELRRIFDERPKLLRMLLTVGFERAESSPDTRETYRQMLLLAEEAIIAGIQDAIGRPVEGCEVVARTVLSFLAGTSLWILMDPSLDLDRLFAQLRGTIVLQISALAPDVVSPADAAGLARDVW